MEERTEKDRGEARCIGILGRSQVTPRWADDPVLRHVSGGSFGAGGGCPPWKDIRRREERAGQVK